MSHRPAGQADPTAGRVVVVGDLVTDVLARLAEPLAVGSDTTARVRLAGGGQGANTAAWLAHHGVPVTLVATVGDDPAGRERVAELVAAGVECAVRPVAGVATGTLVVLSTGQDRSMITDRSAADRLAASDVCRALDRYPDAAHLHLSGYVLLGAGSRAAGRAALAQAADRGLTTSVDAASAGPLRRVGAARFLAWTRGVDLLLANADEAAALTGAHRPPDQVDVLAGYARVVVLKQGAAGALWAGEDRVPVPAAHGPVTDATGAGDAFAAGLLAAWLAGAAPADALAAAAALGARAVATIGARPDLTPPDG